MHSYSASQDTIAPRARLISYGQVRARAKVSCIKFKTRQGNFRFARKDEGSSVDSNIILLCLYIFIECL